MKNRTLLVTQPDRKLAGLVKNGKNLWNLRLADSLPMELMVSVGDGVSEIDLTKWIEIDGWFRAQTPRNHPSGIQFSIKTRRWEYILRVEEGIPCLKLPTV